MNHFATPDFWYYYRHLPVKVQEAGSAGPLFFKEQNMTHVLPFGEVLEAADHLSQDEQEELIAILHRRVAYAARQRMAAEVQQARQEFAEGRCSPATPEELMREILQ